MTVLIEAVELTKRYVRGREQVVAVDTVDYALEQGSLVVLQGPSGSGKTTLLNLLAGWERPDEGRVEWEGAPIDPRRLGWRELAVVPQRIGLLSELTAAENVRLTHRLRGAPADRVVESFERLGLAGLEDSFPDELSAGQQQRVSIARAVAADPLVVLVDEPTSSQDEDHARLVLAEFARLTRTGCACLVASHDPIAVEFADEVLSMRDGRVVSSG